MERVDGSIYKCCKDNAFLRVNVGDILFKSSPRTPGLCSGPSVI